VQRSAIMAGMADLFGIQVRFTARPGQGGALADMLLEAAEGLDDVAECLLYVVSRDAEDPDVVWVAESWSDQEAHTASLQDPGAQTLIERALPLLAAPPEAIRLQPVGGKGLRLP
jgi:quinol monooxygenase YgiN